MAPYLFRWESSSVNRCAAGAVQIMSLAAKLQLKSPVQVLHQPSDVDLGDVPRADDASGALGFAVMAADMDWLDAVFDAARRDDAAWIAYPKAKKLGTDLNRDTLWKALPEGIRPVRQISIDDTWSAMRLRPQ